MNDNNMESPFWQNMTNTERYIGSVVAIIIGVSGVVGAFFNVWFLIACNILVLIQMLATYLLNKSRNEK